jgi:hypothetical protein
VLIVDVCQWNVEKANRQMIVHFVLGMSVVVGILYIKPTQLINEIMFFVVLAYRLKNIKTHFGKML